MVHHDCLVKFTSFFLSLISFLWFVLFTSQFDLAAISKLYLYSLQIKDTGLLVITEICWYELQDKKI